MENQPQNNGSDKPNFFNLYMKVGEMSSDIKSIREDLKVVCKVANDAQKKVDGIQNKAIGVSIVIGFIINIIGFFTDWFGFKNK